MAPRDFQVSVGRQRALWVRPGGKLMAGGQQFDIGAVLIESGTAILEPWFELEDQIGNWELRIPIFTVPPGAFVLKAVATCGLAAIGWNEDAENSVWAVDEVHTEVEGNSQDFFVVPHMGYMGQGGGSVLRVSYHVTVFMGGTDTFHREEVLRDLERV